MKALILSLLVLLAVTPAFAQISTSSPNSGRGQPAAAGLNAAVLYSPAGVGAPAIPGSALAVANGYNVTAPGRDIGGTNDQFHFEYAVQSGDFDIKARIQALELSDLWAKAGLMARATLQDTSPSASVLATPGSAGCFFQFRSTIAKAATNSGSLPSNFPFTWLRLTRVGNLFAGYAGFDGESWLPLGSATVVMPAEVKLGMAVASFSTNRTATAEFRDIADGAGGKVDPGLSLPWEPLGPSSRRTQLVVSEIMRHPAPRPDGLNLEFVEIHNANPFYEDIGGFSLAGDINYTFPPKTVLQGQRFLVVAKDPAALASARGGTNVVGPYVGSLKSSGSLSLLDAAGAVLLKTSWQNSPPWPAGAEGTGHSIVLARPSLGEGFGEAWSLSEEVGGSPGGPEVYRPDPLRNVLLNEMLANPTAGSAQFVELYNHGNEPVDISGCVLTDDPAAARFVVSEGTVLPARGFVSFGGDQLGFAFSAAGGTLLLQKPGQAGVIGAAQYGPQTKGISFGRAPDGGPDWRALSAPTPGTGNARARIGNIAINELMYDPISGSDDDQYVELYNQGGASVDLEGWKFVSGIGFTFPKGAVIPPRGYLVVARNATNLIARQPNLSAANTVGDFSGKLSHGGERVALARPETLSGGVVYIVEDEVTYGAGGRWGTWAAGGGSSLELIDPHSDHTQPGNWADSDESDKAPWTPIDYTGTLDNGNGVDNGTTFPAQALQIVLLDQGECLVDDVQAYNGTNVVNLVTNSTFEAGIKGWTLGGNHSKSSWETVGFNSGHSLHIRSTGGGDLTVNKAVTPLKTPLTQKKQATLKAQARWLKGSPEILLTVRGNWLEAYARLQVPRNLGTPGARNSRAAVNAGPAIRDVRHTPVLPAAGQPVVVTARVDDPDGLSAVVLQYRPDPRATYTSVTMVDDGSRGDAVAGDGIYSATIPGQAVNILVAYYVRAVDSAVPAATANYPGGAPARECLVRFGETLLPSTLGTYHLWMTKATFDTWTQREKLSNAPLDCTFVYGNYRSIYNMGALYTGSPAHQQQDTPTGTWADYSFLFPEDDRLLGVTAFNKILYPSSSLDPTGQAVKTAHWVATQAGLPHNQARFVRLYVNNVRRGEVTIDLQHPNAELINEHFPADPNGELLKVAVSWESDGAGFIWNHARLQQFPTADGTKKLARYRWNWQQHAGTGAGDNFTNLFNLVDAATAPVTLYTQRLDALADTEQWMRVCALQHAVGNWDSYGNANGQNIFVYKPQAGTWKMLIWDIDFCLGVPPSDGPAGDDLFKNTSDPTISKMYTYPRYRRDYYRMLQELANGPFVATNSTPPLDAAYAAFKANGFAVDAPTSIKNYISGRRAYLLSQLRSALTTNFTVNPVGISSASGNLLNLTGTGPVDLESISATVNGSERPVSLTWTTVKNWSLALALSPGANVIVLQGRDRNGRPLANAPQTVFFDYPGQEPDPRGRVVINEIMYHPAAPGAQFIELRNNSDTVTFDLSGWRLEGAGLTFAPGTFLKPLGFLVVAGNMPAYATAYGNSTPVAAEFPGALDPNGETIRLVKPGATPAQDIVASEVRYSNQPPWPASADGLGPSLQLIDSNQDIGRVGNWAVASSGALSTPAAANSVAAVLPTFPGLWINEVQPANLNGPTDSRGHRPPWIELHNSGTTPLDLGGFWLSDSFAALDKWPFPAGTTLAPGGFLLVWADGEPLPADGVELHTNFRLDPSSGSVVLSHIQNGTPVALDYLGYDLLAPGRSFGSFPDGQYQHRQRFDYPTPAAPNNPASMRVPVFINEWMAANASGLADPADGQFDDWFELYNAGNSPADLGGFGLTDDLANPFKSVIGPGIVIPAGGYLLVWADKSPGQNSGPGSIHADFKLGKAGQDIGLFAPDGGLVDSVSFSTQTTDVSQGRSPDGGGGFVFLPAPTPGRANPPTGGTGLRLSDIALSAPGIVSFDWNSEPGKSYRVEYKERLSDPWVELKTVRATQGRTTLSDPMNGQETRYYRIVEVSPP